ncbi:hypothetical protein, conserved [Eimeria maxima]|uniref:Uncharacterized protein n=1 Tax=Eimeria maxima TaxID=5804 RepID=U6M1S2_EIMMA|nr:hypothetical protein, conserved [Eimeria maxima]CDJ57971.1 hypothetical protein, conserved [Eimeria maxima]
MSASAEDEVEEALKGLEDVAEQLQSLLHSVCRRATAIASTAGFESFPPEEGEKRSGGEEAAAAAAAATATAATATAATAAEEAAIAAEDAAAAAAEADIIRVSVDTAENIQRVLANKDTNPNFTQVIKVCSKP